MIDHIQAAERLLTCTEVDRLFRLRHGTARRLADAGEIKAAKRQRGAHECYLIAPEDAREMWGPK